MDVGQVVVVDWDDAYIDTKDFSQKEGEKAKPARRVTVGFFVCETEKGIVLATDHYENIEKDGYAAMMFIPWGMINEWADYERS